MGLTVLAMALAFTASGAGADAAEGSKRVAVFPPSFEGNTKPGWKKQVSEEIVAELREAGFEVVEPEEVLQASGVTECKNDKCLIMVGRAVEADFVTSLHVKLKEKDYVFDAKIVDPNSGKVAAESTETCELCGAVEAVEVAAVQATSLQKKLETLTPTPPRYKLQTDPPGANVLIDGKQVGVTPLELEVDPGAHEIRFEINGYVSEAQNIDAVAGIRESVSFSFPADVADRGPQEPVARGMLIGGSVLTGLGVALVASGVTFVVIDGNSYQAECTGDNVDPAGNCRNVWETKVPGAIFAGIGGAATVAGIGLISAAIVKRKKKRRPSATARIGVTGTGVIVTGRF